MMSFTELCPFVISKNIEYTVYVALMIALK